MIRLLLSLVISLCFAAPALAADYRCEVTTAFIGSGTIQDPNRPAVCDSYPCKKMEDVTGTPCQNITPIPNLYVVKIEVAEATLDSLLLDPNHTVLWYEEILP